MSYGLDCIETNRHRCFQFNYKRISKNSSFHRHTSLGDLGLLIGRSHPPFTQALRRPRFQFQQLQQLKPSLPLGERHGETPFTQFTQSGAKHLSALFFRAVDFPVFIFFSADDFPGFISRRRGCGRRRGEGGDQRRRRVKLRPAVG